MALTVVTEDLEGMGDLMAEVILEAISRRGSGYFTAGFKCGLFSAIVCLSSILFGYYSLVSSMYIRLCTIDIFYIIFLRYVPFPLNALV